MSQKKENKAYRKIYEDVSSYYSAKILAHGPCPEGVDWNGVESQQLRFDQLIKVIRNTETPFSINDLGCGYGALLKYLLEKGMHFEYRGYDLSLDMIAEAKSIWKRLKDDEVGVQFIHGSQLRSADYTVASGIFNVKQMVENDTWLSYIFHVLDEIHAHSKRGFSFNILSTYADPPYMKDYLYYGDPCLIFDHCKSHYSKSVALLHDYELYEFTILVRNSVD
jgi:SAM-dependent methyltransferase